MARPASKHPTDLELEILKILWRDGPLSGKEIRDALTGFRDLAYTSVMTILGIMEDKAYVRRKKSGGNFVYSARVSQQATTRRMLKDLVERAFDGSAVVAMLKLLETSDVDTEELAQLRALIDRKAQERSP